jgi:protease IV
MTQEADHLIDRRRLRRSLTLWRVVTAVLAIVALACAYLFLTRGLGGDGTISTAQQIARVSVSGMITGDTETIKLIERVSESPRVSGIVLSIDSPGGTLTGSEALYEALRKAAAKKPTVAVIGNLAASGGYIAALGADHIVARRTAFVGSIGVLFQYPNVSKLLDQVGVKVEILRSTPLKAAPSGVEPTSDEAKAAIQSLIAEGYDWFKTLVRERRGLDAATLARAADGRVFSGQQALALKLVDAVGNEQDGIDWMVKNRAIPKDLPVKDWRRETGPGRFSIWRGMAWLAQAAGLSAFLPALGQAQDTAQALRQGGLMALWIPLAP